MTQPASGQRFVIASLGSIGLRHLRNLREMRPSATIAALRRPESDLGSSEVCDDQFVTIEQSLAFEPTAAILAGPAPTHVPLAQAFVENDVPVLVEKPLSHDLAGLAALADAADRRNIPVMIGYNLRFNPSLVAMRSEVIAGAIGEITCVRAEVGQYLPYWRPGSDYRRGVSAQTSLGGGALLELSHEIDYVYWLFGMPDRVTCRGGRLSQLEIDVEDCIELCLEYDTPRRLVSIHLDFLQQIATRSCKLIGSQGTILWDGIEDRYEIKKAKPEPTTRVIDAPMQDRNEMYVAELAAFLSAIETGQNVPIPLAHGIDVMRIIAAARLSLKRGGVERPRELEFAA